MSRMAVSGNIKGDGTITAAGKGGVTIPTSEKNAQFRKLKMLRENAKCFDCPNTRPTWASVNHGTLRYDTILFMRVFDFVRMPTN